MPKHKYTAEFKVRTVLEGLNFRMAFRHIVDELALAKYYFINGKKEWLTMPMRYLTDYQKPLKEK